MKLYENLADNPKVCDDEGTAIIQKVGISYGNSLSSALHTFTVSYVRILGEWRRDVSWGQITEQGRDWDILKCAPHNEIADIAHDMTPESIKDWWVNYKGISIPITIHLFSTEVELP